MGTLFDQRVRSRYEIEVSNLDEFIAKAVKLAEKYDISVADVIAAKTALEHERSNDLYVANGDAFDEQIAGFGKLVQELTGVIHDKSLN